MTKATPELAEAVRSLSASFPAKQVAKQLSLPLSVVNNILAGKFDLLIDRRTPRRALQHIWTAMISRCHDSTNPRYADYGGKGIQVCDKWHKFDVFCEWAIRTGYEKGLSIERKRNHLNYSPHNCVWISRYLQNRNKKGVRWLTAFGKTMTMVEWSEQDVCAVEYGTFRDRIHSGWEAERALTTKLRGSQLAA